MSNLVPCKSCKKEIDKTAKTCPHCGVKSPGMPASEVAKGCLVFIVIAIIIVLVNSCEEDKATQQTASPVTTEEVKVDNREIRNEFPITIDQFLVRYNRSLSALSYPSKFKISSEIKNQQTTSATLSTNSKIIGASVAFDTSSRALQSVIFIGNGDGTAGSGVEIAFGSVAVIMALEDPSMLAEQRGEILESIGLLNGQIFDKEKIILERNNIRYTVLFSKITGLWLTADPLTSSYPNNDSFTLSDGNINDFVVELSNDYLTNLGMIVKNYKQYKQKNDYRGFILWRSDAWMPQYEILQNKYQSTLENNRRYLFGKDEFKLITAFSDLLLVSLKLMTSLRDNNQSDADFAVKKIKEDAPLFDSMIKARGLEDKIKSFNTID